MDFHWPFLVLYQGSFQFSGFFRGFFRGINHFRGFSGFSGVAGHPVQSVLDILFAIITLSLYICLFFRPRHSEASIGAVYPVRLSVRPSKKLSHTLNCEFLSVWAEIFTKYA